MEAPELLAFFKKFGASIVCVLIIGVLYPLPAADYEISAHAALTQAIFDFHNQSFPDRAIPLEYRYDLIAGAMDEDSGVRSLYHFYDPINGKGLKFGKRRFMPATDWVRDKTAPDNDYTWDAALTAYAAGDNKTAFVALGHVLHLLEDLGTPEHTRNDPHPIASPYEEFTRNLVPAVPVKSPIALGGVRDYFVSLAKYSNENFYSADTIDDEYAKPQPDRVRREGKYMYGFKSDEIGGLYHLVRYVAPVKYSWVDRDVTKSVLDKDEDKVLSDYWRLLSAKTVQHGAGLVHLFFTEGEKLRVAESTKAKGRQKVVARGTLANIAEAFAPFFGGGDFGDGLTEDDEVDASDGVFYPPAQSPGAAKKKTPAAGDEDEKPGTVKPASIAVSKPALVPLCAYTSSASPTKSSLVINEVAWMGSKASATNEWIELKNITASSVDISGWQLISKKGNIEIRFPAGSSIPPEGFYLLERTGDDAVLHIKASYIYQGALSNTGDGLHLYAPHCALVDAVEASPAWPAGNAAERRTMELGVTGLWHSYAGAVSGGIFGTPKRENGPPPTIVITPPKQTAVGGSGGAGTSGISSGSSSSGSFPAAVSGTGSVRVNEILFDAEGVDAGKEFIELHNPGTATVDLTGWSIQTQTAKKNFEDGNAIPALGCFLITMGSGAPTPALGMRFASGSLNNTSGTVYIVRNQDFVSGDGDTDIADRAAYSNSLPGFVPGASVERDPAGPFRVRAVPNPGDCSRAGSSGSSSGISSSSSANAPSGGFLKSAYFYQDPASDGSLIDLHWNTYPFVPGGTDGAKVLVFYKNSAPAIDSQVSTAGGWTTDDSHVLSVRYPTYCGAGCRSIRKSLVLPDIPAMSQSGQGVAPVTYNYPALVEDKMARMSADGSSPGDYITIAYYDLSYSAGGNQSFALVLADPTKYYFNDPKPTHAAPVLLGDLAQRFDEARNILTVTLPLATDADSADALLSYSFSLNGKLLGLGYSAGGDYSFVVAAGDTFDISYSAADEFSARSLSLGDEWSFPGAVTWAIRQDQGDANTFTLGRADQNCSSCDRTASYQGISFPADTPINAVSVRIKSDRGRPDATLRMRLYGDLGGASLAEKSLALGSVPLHIDQDISFIFPSPVTLRADTPYWLVLDVTDYTNSNDQYAPYLYQRIAGGDPYPGGTSGWRTTASLIPDWPGGSDWQMRVGLWER